MRCPAIRLLFAAMAGCLSAASASAVSISLDPSSPVVLVGGSLDIEVVIAGLGAPGPPSLRSFDLDVAFPSALLSFDGLDFGTDLGALPDDAIAGVFPGVGVVDFFEVSLLSTSTLDADQPADFTLATLHFTVLAAGLASFTLPQVTLADAVGSPITPDEVNGTSVLLVVPEPAPAMLVLLGTLLVGALRRRRVLALLALCALLAPERARAMCNVIPTAVRSFPSEAGIVNRPIAAPGDPVAVSTNPGCEPGQPLFDDEATDNVVVLRFEPPSGPTSDILVPAGSITVASCAPAGCSRLIFVVPDTDSDLPPAGDGNGLAGPARILIARDGGATPVAEIATLFEPTAGCDEQPETLFQRFTVVPQLNDFAALVAGSVANVRATLDGGNNLIIPFDYGDALAAPPGSPIFSILAATASNVPAFTGGAALRLPPAGAIRSFSIIGRPIPPLLRVDAEGDTVFGSVDAREGILRVQRVNPGSPDFYDFTDRFLVGRGPILIPVDAADVRSPAPLPSLRADGDAVSFALDETSEGDLNLDGDAFDQIPQVLDAATGAVSSTLLAVDEISQPGFNKPAIAGAGPLAALLESEARNGLIYPSIDLDAFDHVLRVYDATGSEITLGQTILADAAPVLNGAPLVVDPSGLVFFRTRESDAVARTTRRVRSATFLSNPVSLSRDGRFVAVDTASPLDAAADPNTTSDIYVIDRDTDQDGIFDETGATSAALASVGTNGLAGTAGSGVSPVSLDPSLSADGRHVAFRSAASNLVAGDANGLVDIFVRDLALGTTLRVSTPDGVTSANGTSTFPSISDDGRFVAFSTGATNIISGLGADGGLVLFDRDQDGDGTFDEPGQVWVANTVPESRGGDGVALSGDARTVAICSNAPFGGPTPTFSEVRVVRFGSAARRLPTLDGLAPNRESCTHGAGGLAVSADGRYTAFSSQATNLAANGPPAGSTTVNVYVYDYETHGVEIVSLSTGGAPATAGQAGDPSISDDGRFVGLQATFDFQAGSGTAIGAEGWIYDRVTDTIELASADDEGDPSISGASTNGRGALSGDGRQYAFQSNSATFDGSTTSGIFARRHDPDRDADGALDPGISLNAADGDALDTVLQVFDAQTAALRPNAVAPASVVAVAGRRAAILTPESEDGEGSGASNGDADTLDQIAQVYDATTTTDSLASLDVAAVRIALSDQVVCMAVPEASQPGASNGDADSADHLLAYWRIGQPVGSLVVTGYTVSTVQTIAALSALGPYCVFGSAESDSVGTPGFITNGAPAIHRVLGVLDTSTGTLWSSTSPAAAEIVVGDSPALAAFRTCEASEGVDINGDGDLIDCVMRVLDVASGTPAIVDTGRAAQPCTFPACDPFFEPYRVNGDTVSFLAREGDQSGPGPGLGVGCAPAGGAGQCDYLGDGDADDTTIQVFSVRSERVQSFRIVESNPPDVPPFPDTQDGQTSLTLQLPESSLGEDLNEDGQPDGEDVNEDGDLDDSVVVILGDSDEDGSLDGSVESGAADGGEADNCTEIGNATQFDFDGDRLGDQACDPSPFSGLLICDVDGNARVDRADIELITQGRGQVVTQTDLRDPNQSGVIDVIDAAFCANRCTYANCRMSPPAGCGLGGVELMLGIVGWWGLRRARNLRIPKALEG